MLYFWMLTWDIYWEPRKKVRSMKPHLKWTKIIVQFCLKNLKKYEKKHPLTTYEKSSVRDNIKTRAALNHRELKFIFTSISRGCFSKKISLKVFLKIVIKCKNWKIFKNSWKEGQSPKLTANDRLIFQFFENFRILNKFCQ